MTQPSHLSAHAHSCRLPFLLKAVLERLANRDPSSSKKKLEINNVPARYDQSMSIKLMENEKTIFMFGIAQCTSM